MHISNMQWGQINILISKREKGHSKLISDQRPTQQSKHHILQICVLNFGLLMECLGAKGLRLLHTSMPVSLFGI